MAEPLTAPELCTLMDGEAPDAAARRDLERRLATDPAATRRLALWRRNDDALRAAFGLRRPDRRPDDRRLDERRVTDREAPIGPLQAAELGRGRRVALLAAAIAFLAGAACATGGFLLLHMLRAP